jgi:hypothetical protein
LLSCLELSLGHGWNINKRLELELVVELVVECRNVEDTGLGLKLHLNKSELLHVVAEWRNVNRDLELLDNHQRLELPLVEAAGVIAFVGAGVSAFVGAGVSAFVGAGVSAGVSAFVGADVGTGVVAFVGADVGAFVGAGVCAGVGAFVGAGVGAGVSAFVGANVGAGFFFELHLNKRLVLELQVVKCCNINRDLDLLDNW